MMNMIDNKLINAIVEDITGDGCADDLNEALFSNDKNIDYDKLLSLLEFRYEYYSGKLTDEEKEMVRDYLCNIQDNENELEYLIFSIENKLSEDESLAKEKIIALEFTAFWILFSIACKKCVDDSNAKFIDHSNFLERFVITTDQQKEAFLLCKKGFEMNSKRFSRGKTYNLDLFLPTIRSNKNIKKKKKNIHRVLRRTKKIMQINKMAHRNNGYNIFMGKTYLVPDQFVKTVINDFMN